MKKLIVAVIIMLTFVPQLVANEDIVKTAEKAINGEFGQLQEWQRKAYQLVLDKGIINTKIASCTHYYPPEPDARFDAHGNRCSTRTVAANKLPQYSLIYIEGVGVRQVLDRGAKWNDNRWCFKIINKKRIRITDLWVDIWNPRPKGNIIRKIHIIRLGK